MPDHNPRSSPAPGLDDTERPRKRPMGAMRGLGFIPSLWITTALKRGLIPSSRAHTVLAILADAVDADGRWCWLRITTIAARSGGTLSTSTVKRALADLEQARLIRRLPKSAVHAFFADDLAAGRRTGDRLPDVIELLIPASAFPTQTVEEINAVRAELGECPLTPTTRPDHASTNMGHAAEHPGRDAGSDRSPDLCPEDPHPQTTSPTGPPSSTGTIPERSARIPEPRLPDPPARGTSADPAPSEAALHALRLVPDAALAFPNADRRRLALRLDSLAAQGVSWDDLKATVAAADTATRPYAALMARLAGPASAHAWLARAPKRAEKPTGEPDSPAPEREISAVCPSHPSIRPLASGCPLCAAAAPGRSTAHPAPGSAGSVRHTGTEDAHQAAGPHGLDAPNRRRVGLSPGARAAADSARAHLAELKAAV
ncbi:helix-turn-helix domain-containing protein [Streptomonospora salina]|uniref:Helix-turn-helix domain-containing protein n=1 Tax=Streptomonospora salina TaxID=104205 RepID=A0A841EE71_9ACTN|nr:helix-turn-helix domain-containing protein [Streptomonospora salina]MBB5998730.1 hypothetical protein [Streptomonospora salina]